MMINKKIHLNKLPLEATKFCQKVITQSEQAVSGCYHCQRCGGGCPVAIAAGITPNQWLRLLHLGFKEEALKSPLLWLCVGCGTCGARCPNEISTNIVIDQCREYAASLKIISPEVKKVRLFHKLFLRQIHYFGRLHEAFLLGLLKTRTGEFFKDIDLGFKMFRKGKIPLLPHYFKGIRGVKKIFRRRQP